MPAADIRDDERRRLFGCVEQTFHMVPGTVRDQITLYDSTISDEAVHTAAELTGLKDTIESMEKGYDTRCTDDLFSQGQWQLLSIARAAAAAPSMLLFDEITANLDAETERSRAFRFETRSGKPHRLPSRTELLPNLVALLL